MRERSTSMSSSQSGGGGGTEMLSPATVRLNIDHLMEGKENLSLDSCNSTGSPEQIVCAPSLPGSPPLTPSPKRSSHSPRGILAASPNSLSLQHLQAAAQHHHLQQQQHAALLRPLLSASASDLAARLAEPTMLSAGPTHSDRQSIELALRLSGVVSNDLQQQQKQQPQPKTQILNINKKNNSGGGGGGGVGSLGQPQIFVKQGVSKCKECNIVFCKYENYLAHKKHYCSARNLDDKDGVGGGGGGTGTKPSPPVSPNASGGGTGLGGSSGGGGSHLATGPLQQYQQLICAACGTKFASLDNLSAHQMYYCTKRIEMPIQVNIWSLFNYLINSNTDFSRFSRAINSQHNQRKNAQSVRRHTMPRNHVR